MYTRYVIEAFTNGDCWALALEMKARFPHLTVCTLVDPYWAGDDDVYDHMEWSHALVFDRSTRIYYDVTGAYPEDEAMTGWDEFNWTEVYEIPDEDIEDYFSDQTRMYPDISLDDGVTLATVDMPVLSAVG